MIKSSQCRPASIIEFTIFSLQLVQNTIKISHASAIVELFKM